MHKSEIRLPNSNIKKKTDDKFYKFLLEFKNWIIILFWFTGEFL